ncbi:hypothetical protein, partial [Chloroflexus sp.]|uniref:hypothetical protein n=1 Tax=Chloroflexus sp. TaxID=1904827 RepID=UPI002ADD8758
LPQCRSPNHAGYKGESVTGRDEPTGTVQRQSPLIAAIGATHALPLLIRSAGQSCGCDLDHHLHGLGAHRYRNADPLTTPGIRERVLPAEASQRVPFEANHP